ncbi:ssDNA-binding transcriptional regulator [Poronia punctata]|nr:ssDNA-binding transcriptional regulator [Poronia punctata]
MNAALRTLKTMGKTRKHEASSEEENVKSKKVKVTSASSEAEKDSEGNAFFALSANRRVVTQDFKGKTYINIREYYSDASGELKPGKKGIMLTLEQYNTFLGLIPAINAELKSKGHEISDVPATATAVATVASTSAAEPPTKAPPKELKNKNKKMNIEATSDEESE